jgi:hypothetical protein
MRALTGSVSLTTVDLSNNGGITREAMSAAALAR